MAAISQPSRLQTVAALGQQIWLDQLSRGLIAGGELEHWVREEAIQGVTTNPAIFHQAISQDPAYRTALAQLQGTPEEKLEALVLPDIRAACDLLALRYQATDGQAGFVSLELPPQLAHDTEASVAEAKRLWQLVERPNVMIKVPATPAGIAALEHIVEAGIHTNMTLIFTLNQLNAVRAAHRRGLARRLEARQSVQRIASVASVFISRVDAAVDALLPPSAAELRGQTAIASARIAYADWQNDAQFAVFRAFGALPQWLLWASTGTKDPALPPTHYVDELIGPETINTVPMATLRAFREQGSPRLSLAGDLAAARAVLAQLGRHGIDLDTIGNELLGAGLRQFEDAHAKLLALLA